MPKDLIALTCPQCGASLECDSTNMKIFCQYCGTPILIKDFITQRRIDNSDKIISYNNIINNAINNNDYETVHKYYEKICNIEASENNLLLLSISSYLTGKLDFNKEWLKNLYNFSLTEHEQILQMLIKGTKANMQKEIESAKHISNEKIRKKKIRNIDLNYNSIIYELYKEEKNLKPIKCKCKQMLTFDMKVCPKCGRLRSEIVKKKKRRDNIIATVLISLIVVFILMIIIAL